MKETLEKIKRFLFNRFDLNHERINEDIVLENIRKGIVFEGTKLWTLIFAIFIASIGLNINSTAVIIGAMLISPLMGPILGIGMGAAIYDFPLIKKSFANLSLATIISIFTAFVYFKITPLAEVQSELLARTTPTIWDVLIAFFGGATGMIANNSSAGDKANPIAGVAIATALMPPLATAGFGLATARPEFFFGAFYLYFINAVMISISTFLVTKFLKFTPLPVATKKGKAIKQSIILLTVVTITPSIFLMLNLIKESIYENNVNQFIQNEFKYPRTQIFKKEIVENEEDDLITLCIYTIGQPLGENEISRLKNRVADYKLKNTQIRIMDITKADRQGKDYMTDIRNIAEATISHKEKELEQMRTRLNMYEVNVAEIAREINVWVEDIPRISVAKTRIFDLEKDEEEWVGMVLIETARPLDEPTQKKIENFISQKLGCEKVYLFMEKPESPTLSSAQATVY